MISVKVSEIRDLPIDHETLTQIYIMAKQNPLFSDLSYVFFSPVKLDQPYWPSYYVDGLYEALEKNRHKQGTTQKTKHCIPQPPTFLCNHLKSACRPQNSSGSNGPQKRRYDKALFRSRDTREASEYAKHYAGYVGQHFERINKK